MINNYDLYDITAAFIIIRNDIMYEHNVEIINQIINALSPDMHLRDDNCIREAIATIKHLDCNKWNFVFHNNVYTQRKLVGDPYIYELLKAICCEMKRLLFVGKYAQALDLSDAVHCLPQIIADSGFHVPRSFWKLYIKPYRKKWDKSFLLNYQSRLHNTAIIRYCF